MAAFCLVGFAAGSRGGAEAGTRTATAAAIAVRSLEWTKNDWVVLCCSLRLDGLGEEKSWGSM